MDEKTFFRRSWTWGVIMTVIGKMVHAVLGWFGYKAERNMYGYVIYIGKGWGGAGMGPYCIACRDISVSTLNHEFGHAIQNCYFGPF
jgi:hypothetical protein